MNTGKTIALTIQTFVGKVMSLLFNTVSSFVIAFLPRSKCLLISWLQSSSAMILEPKKIRSVTVSIFSPSICHEVMGLDVMILVFWMLSFKPAFFFGVGGGVALFLNVCHVRVKSAFSCSSFTLTERLSGSSLLSAIRVVSSALSEVVDISSNNLDSSLWFIQPGISYSAQKLNK